MGLVHSSCVLLFKLSTCSYYTYLRFSDFSRPHVVATTAHRLGQRPVASVRPMLSSSLAGSSALNRVGILNHRNNSNNQLRAPGFKPGVSVQQIQTTTGECSFPLSFLPFFIFLFLFFVSLNFFLFLFLVVSYMVRLVKYTNFYSIKSANRPSPTHHPSITHPPPLRQTS